MALRVRAAKSKRVWTGRRRLLQLKDLPPQRLKLILVLRAQELELALVLLTHAL